MAPTTTENYTLNFEGDDDIPVSLLGSYLMHFRTVHKAVELLLEEKSEWNPTPEEYYQISERLRREHIVRAARPFPYPRYRYDPDWHDGYFEKDILKLVRINKNSPLEIVLCGAISAITIAVIFSGGTVEVGKTGIKAKLPPIGKGIKKLRDAINDKYDKG
ncbi:hypothetical protein [Pelagicoccus albus]|uniref:Uncharacterized protein n=1 Tax=Pelagicoccus albus TaxID=415222 RepID=A0A7X1E8G0_9BACT|nr:hypothetical protein [Pelagicoccus albus]MBC2606319.1 hypothetical protein [Pelagicoccus albus]